MTLKLLFFCLLLISADAQRFHLSTEETEEHDHDHANHTTAAVNQGQENAEQDSEGGWSLWLYIGVPIIAICSLAVIGLFVVRVRSGGGIGPGGNAEESVEALPDEGVSKRAIERQKTVIKMPKIKTTPPKLDDDKSVIAYIKPQADKKLGNSKCRPYKSNVTTISNMFRADN